MLARCIAALLFLMRLSGEASSAEIRHQPAGDGAGFIANGGRLELGDELAFRELAERYERCSGSAGKTPGEAAAWHAAAHLAAFRPLVRR